MNASRERKAIIMADLTKQFSIDWLTGNQQGGTQNSSAPDRGAAALEEAFFLYSHPIIQRLRAPQPVPMRLFDLAKAVNEEILVQNFDEFRAVVNRMVERGLVDVVERDSLTGNDLIQWHKE